MGSLKVNVKCIHLSDVKYFIRKVIVIIMIKQCDYKYTKKNIDKFILRIAKLVIQYALK